MQKKKKAAKKRPDKPDELELPVYCVCRSTDGERFMIACDRCEEWYHGDCISVTPKQAEQIKTFYCHQCRRKEPTLQIEYKSARSHKSEHKSTKTKRTTPSSVSVKSDKSRNERSPFQVPDEVKTSSVNYEVPGDEFVNGVPNGDAVFLDTVGDYPVDFQGHSSAVTTPRLVSRNRVTSPKSRLCGICTGCTRLEDCGQCDYCRDRRKFGGPNRIRQKCRLRQCVGSGHHRDPITQPQGARRRKQQSVQHAALGSSPQSTQFVDSDPFLVSNAFSPRSRSAKRSTVCSPSSAGGSKSRRGDARTPIIETDLDPFSRGRQRLPLVASDGAMVDFLDEDSDDDLLLSGFPHCAGPACMSAPVAGGRYCSDACRTKHLKYNLPYPDHMYCRHHRVYSWHNNSSSPSTMAYRTNVQPQGHFQLDHSSLNDTVNGGRIRSGMSYASSPVTSQRAQVPRILTANDRLSELDNHEHSVLCDCGDATDFMDSVETAMMRGVVPLTGELNFDGLTHSSVPGNTLPSMVNSYYPRVHARPPTMDLRHFNDVDGLMSELDPDLLDSDLNASGSANQFYYIRPYAELTRRSSGSTFMASSSGDRRDESIAVHSKNSLNNGLLLPDNSDASIGLGSGRASSRLFTLGSSSSRHRAGPMNGSSFASSRPPLSSVRDSSPIGTSNPLSYLPGPDEFYTINDSDDIEINWPQESVSGLNV